MACIVVSRITLVLKVEGEVGILLASVEILMFSLDMDSVFVEGYIMRDGYFVGVLDCSESHRITEFW